jgi:para-nitrobenzyl esterase
VPGQSILRNFALFIVLAAFPASAADSGPVVAVTGGRIRGAALPSGGAVFKDIPYAQPPVGELRWREPLPVKRWTGVRDAAAFGAPCAQRPNPFAPGAGEMSNEDCLHLNVWTSAWPPKGKRAVMVWIPGGANTTGTASQALYDGTSLSALDVILVTIDYRLGPFGFFSHPELTKESPHHASGNQAFLDQIAALQWVRENILKFGGDPANVTVFGESAGAIDISVLMTSPLAKGLFHRVIAESGAALGTRTGNPLSLQAAEEAGVTMVSKLGLASGSSLKALRELPTERILANAGPPASVIDEYVFNEKPSRVFAAGKEVHVGLLMGNNSRDGIPGSVPPTDLRKTIEENYGPLAPRAIALYGKPEQSDPVYGTPAEQWGADTSFRCTAVLQLTWHAAAGNPTFEYEFARVPVGKEKEGATHASELSYVFGTLDRVGLIGAPPMRVTSEDRQVSELMQKYWTNFAKTGNPNGAGLPVWPKFDATSRAYVQFTDGGPLANEGLRRSFCDVFMENAKRE